METTQRIPHWQGNLPDRCIFFEKTKTGIGKNEQKQNRRPIQMHGLANRSSYGTAYRVWYRLQNGSGSMQGGPSDVVKIHEIRFTQTRRGMLRLRPEIGNPNPEDAVGLASGSSGLSVTNSGTCLERKWKRQGREYARLRVSSDLKSEKIVSYRIRTGTVLIRNGLFPCLRMQRDTAP